MEPDQTPGGDRLKDTTHERLRRIYDSAPDIVYSYRFRPEPSFDYLSPAVTAITGYTPVELCGNADLIRRIVHPDDWAQFAKIPESNVPTIVVVRWIARDGQAVWLELHAVPVVDADGAVIGVEGIARNITRRQEAEDAVGESAARLRLALDSAEMLVWSWDIQTGATVFTGNMEPFGVLTEPTSFTEVLALVHPDDRDSLLQAIEERLAGVRSEHEVEVRLVGDDGGERWVTARGNVVTDESGAPTLMVGTAFDITSRKRGEETLRVSEDALEAIVQSAPVAIIAIDREWRVTRWNRAAESMFGWSAAEILGNTLLPLVPPEEREHSRALLTDVLAGRRVVNQETRRVCKDGTSKDVILSMSPLHGPEEEVTGVLGTFTDISKQVEAQRRREESFEALQRVNGERRGLLERLIGAQEEERQRIASDIHDDSIQVLTALALRLELFGRQIDDPELLGAIEELQLTARSSLARLRQLIFELRPPALDREGLVPVLRDYLAQMQQDRGIDCRLESDLSVEPSPETRAIVYRIAQEALLNVAKHAQATHVTFTLRSVDEGILVRIHDDGHGFAVDPDKAPEPGHIGLTTMRERAEMTGGWWRIESQEGGGATVEFLISDG